MSKSQTVTQTVTANDVREFYRADAKRMARLSDAAQATVRKGARGRLHAEVIADHNSKRRTRQYVLGESTRANKARTAARAALVEQGLAGKRGPVRKARETVATDKG